MSYFKPPIRPRHVIRYIMTIRTGKAALREKDRSPGNKAALRYMIAGLEDILLMHARGIK